MENNKLDSKMVKISLIMLLGMIAPALDATVVNVAIKTIVSELHSSISVAQWITTAYILTMGITVPISGWLVNRFSGKAVYMISLVVFGLGSIGAALAWNIESLIVFRVVQAAGAGVMMPVTQTVLVRYAGGAKLPRLMAILGIPMAIIPILGPTIGGLVVNYLPWQWIFVVNIPICVIAFIVGQVCLPPVSAVNRQQPLDIIGLLLLSPAFCVIIFGISKLRSEASGASQMAALYFAAGAILLIAYCIYVLRSKKEPPLNIRLFKDKNFSASTVLILLYGMFSTGTLFILPLFFQQTYKVSALAAGLLLAPQGIGMLLTRTLSAKLMEKIGGRPVILAGLVCTLLGTVPLALFHTNGSLIFPIIILLIRGAGLGLALVPIMTGVYDGLDKKDVPQGTTATRIFQQIGGALGTAVLAIILSHDLAATNDANIFTAFNPVFWWSAVFAAVSIIPVFILAKKKTVEQQEKEIRQV